MPTKTTMERTGTPTLSDSREQKLSDVAKKLVRPKGQVVWTLWAAVYKVITGTLGLGLDGWQKGAGQLILGQREDGKLACMIGGVGMSLPRQVGKTYLIAALIFALAILKPGLLVIWSAQLAKTHNETFLAMQAFAGMPKIAPYIRQVFVGSGDEEIRFTNGSRILFGARERGFGRGIPGVDVIVSDEAQIMSEKAIDAQLATMNTSDFGLAIYVGTPPRPEDNSEGFTRMRTEAWAGTLEDAVWIELGAAPKKAAKNPLDRKQWAKANPSYPHRTPPESMLRLQRKLSPESFLREGLGVWDSDMEKKTILNMGQFDKLAQTAPDGKPCAYGIDMDPLQTRVSISVAVRGPDGRVHVEEATVIEVAMVGTQAVVDWVCDRNRAGRRLPVVMDGRSPARILRPDFLAAKARLFVLNAPELLEACGGITKAFQTKKATHFGQKRLRDALKAAEKQKIGDSGGWKWALNDPSIDNTALMSATCAWYGAAKTKRPERDTPPPERAMTVVRRR